MLILITENPGQNSYILSLIKAYEKAGHKVICSPHNFFYSNLVPDLVHIHWPERFYKWHEFAKTPKTKQYDIIKSRIEWYKKNNTIIISTLHNFEPHALGVDDQEKKIFEEIYSSSNILVHHCPESVNLFKRKYPQSEVKTHIVCNHGDYLIDYEDIPKVEARKKINIPENRFIILNFGGQQAYKGRNFISKVFSSLKIRNKYLLTVGNFGYNEFNTIWKYYHKFINYCKEHIKFPNKKFVYRSISNNEIKYYLNAADILFLGHSEGLNSGILNLAATFSKPVVHPNIGCFHYQIDGWISKEYERSNIQSAKKEIEQFFLSHQKENLDYDNTVWLSTNSWDNHVKKIIEEVNLFIHNK